MQARPLMPLDDVRTRYYLRFQVHDRPGVLARLAGALGEAGVSIEQMVQEGGAGSSGVPVDIVMLTHDALGAGRAARAGGHRWTAGWRRRPPGSSVSRSERERSRGSAVD